ncbi:MAG: YCF48-related protein [Candidatus Sulfotelmatobacter sp.]
MQEVPQFVLKRLRETAVAGSHPDADVLTAFAEQSLPVSERGRVIEHLAACGDCRDVVALALPATEIEVAPVSTTRARGWWLGLPVLRWGALAAGLTVAISIGVFQYSHRRNGDMVASNRAQEAVTLPSSSDLLHATQKAVSRTETGTQPSSVLGSPVPSGQKPAVEVSRRDRAAGHDIVIAQLAQNANALSAPVNSHSAAKRKNQVAQQIAQNDSPLLPDRGNATNLTSFDVVKAKDPVPAQSTSSNAPTSLASASPLQTSPSLMSRALPLWTVTSSGVLQRSFDGGNTWENVNPTLNEGQANTHPANQKAEVAVDPNAAFRAVAALGPEVWAGGSSGVLYHTSDGGNHWIRVTPSTAAAGLTGDIIRIQFADPQHGRISTSNAELWTTSDSGETWQRQQ